VTILLCAIDQWTSDGYSWKQTVAFVFGVLVSGCWSISIGQRNWENLARELGRRRRVSEVFGDAEMTRNRKTWISHSEILIGNRGSSTEGSETGTIWKSTDLEILRFCINRIKREAWESEGSRNRNMRIVERELALPSFERNAREGFSWRGTRQGPRQSRQRMFQQRKVRLCPLSDELDRITSRQTVSQTDSRK